ncbi:C6 zinc cluster transcription factor-like protein [Basidiobolus ranarum]|uniref:C6 zinc cluster transcription factor-like protein n=1 Tax=Basidiobolus ranarum TaxID=34480 RepID=A0ABR2WJA3_9FUNG
MLETIYITRHGFRQDWVTEHALSPTKLPQDPPLAEIGLQQAQELSARLANEKIDAIYSSPFYRCLQTVTPVAEKADCPIKVEYGMSEWYGLTHEQYQPPAPLKELKGYFSHIDDTYTSMIALPTGKETTQDCHLRSKALIEKLVTALDQDPTQPKTVLLAGHAATVITAGRALLNDPDAYIYSGTASLSQYTRDPKTNKWTMVLNGSTDYLSMGEQRSWMFHDAPGTTNYEVNKEKIATIDKNEQ